MSISDYLSTLDKDQLYRAKEELERLIKEKEEENKVTLYILAGSLYNQGCFYKKDFNKAKQKLAEYILSEDYDESNVRHYPRLQKIKVGESEVAGYMELND